LTHLTGNLVYWCKGLFPTGNSPPSARGNLLFPPGDLTGLKVAG
jgi:hypothetical protein